MELELSIFLEKINYHKAFCSLLITNYGHGTGLPDQGILFSRSGQKVREFLFWLGNFKILLKVREFWKKKLLTLS